MTIRKHSINSMNSTVVVQQNSSLVLQQYSSTLQDLQQAMLLGASYTEAMYTDTHRISQMGHCLRSHLYTLLVARPV